MDEHVDSSHKMIHSSERKKDVELSDKVDYTDLQNNYGLIMSEKFYAIADLAKDGFIHADGSLRFEFKIRRKRVHVEYC